MAEEKSKSSSGTSGSGQPSGAAPKRPFATLDLKATEIKVTPISDKMQSSARSAAAAAAEAANSFSGAQYVPMPAPASTYAIGTASTASKYTETVSMGSSAKQTTGTAQSAARAASSNAPQETVSAGAKPTVRVERRGGFFSHLAAGLAGGALAFGAIVWLLPRLGVQEFASMPGSGSSELSQRLSALEQSAARAGRDTADTADLAKRIAGLETAAQAIPSLTESQRRLVAETKAALASSASDNGSTELIVRLGKIEDKMKALADAGANDPNAGRVEQLAALTGKVSDLETSLGTQLTELRKSVAQDVDGRVLAATQTSEAARAGTQRIDRDIAGIKSDATRLEQSVRTAAESADKASADIKSVREETAQAKSDIDAIKTAAVKPADIAAAVGPLNERTAALEKNVKDILTAEDARKASAENVVLALELQNLKRALDSGQQYAAQLAEVQKAAGGKFDLSALARLQNTGVPARAELVKDFDATANAAIEADTATGDDGVIDRLWEGAKSVIKVRRIDSSPDDKSTEATIGRMQVALNDGRLGDVVQESKALSPKAQAASRPFLDKLEARLSVDTALANLEKGLKASMAEQPQQTAKP